MSAETDILLADQQAINRFARLTADRADISKNLTSLEEQISALSDARDEVELLMEPEVKVLVGETFILLSEDQALARIERSLEKSSQSKDELHVQVETIDAERQSLKSHLYARFGGNINLEDE
jgi:prefoldin subunit 4